MVVYSCPPEITNITWQPRIDPVTPGGVFFHGEGQRQGVSQSLLQAVTRGRERKGNGAPEDTKGRHTG